MKNSLIIIFLLTNINLFCQIDTILNSEKEMITQINLLRTNPKSYVHNIETYIKDYDTSDLAEPNKVIEKLKKLAPVSRVYECDYINLNLSFVSKNNLPNIGVVESIVYVLLNDPDGTDVMLSAKWKFVSVVMDKKNGVMYFAY